MSGIEIVPAGHNRWQAVANGIGWAMLRWSGERMVVYVAERREIGTLYRSDGRWTTGADGNRFIAYTWRAYLPGPGGRELARGVSQAEAVSAVLEATDDLDIRAWRLGWASNAEMTHQGHNEPAFGCAYCAA